MAVAILTFGILTDLGASSGFLVATVSLVD
jgi:hypothetical protein